MRLLHTRTLSASKEFLRLPINTKEIPLTSLKFHEVKAQPPLLVSSTFDYFGSLNQNEQELKRRYNMNVGRAIDTLRHDIPLLFKQAPRLDVFTTDIKLMDPKGTICSGKYAYSILLNSLRIAKALDPVVQIKTLRYFEDSGEIQIKFSLIAEVLPMNAVMENIHFEAVSRYVLNGEGFIHEHHIDNVTRNRLFRHSFLPIQWGRSPTLSMPHSMY
jgi:hypothetical protein